MRLSKISNFVWFWIADPSHCEGLVASQLMYPKVWVGFRKEMLSPAAASQGPQRNCLGARCRSRESELWKGKVVERVEYGSGEVVTEWAMGS